MATTPKDRARPFSKKHRKYWIPITGGMLLIGVINVVVGVCTYDPPSDVHQQIHPVIPKSTMTLRPAQPDAGVDAK